MTFIKKSGILQWERENIDSVPDTCGVYTLRSNTRIGGILYVGKAGVGRLKERILEHFKSKDIPGVIFFDWYETRTEDDAKALESFWRTRYNPPHNVY